MYFAGESQPPSKLGQRGLIRNRIMFMARAPCWVCLVRRAVFGQVALASMATNRSLLQLSCLLARSLVCLLSEKGRGFVCKHGGAGLRSRVAGLDCVAWYAENLVAHSGSRLVFTNSVKHRIILEGAFGIMPGGPYSAGSCSNANGYGHRARSRGKADNQWSITNGRTPMVDDQWPVTISR